MHNPLPKKIAEPSSPSPKTTLLFGHQNWRKFTTPKYRPPFFKERDRLITRLCSPALFFLKIFPLTFYLLSWWIFTLYHGKSPIKRPFGRICLELFPFASNLHKSRLNKLFAIQPAPSKVPSNFFETLWCEFLSWSPTFTGEMPQG